VEVPSGLSGEHVPDFLPSRLGLDPRQVSARGEECVGIAYLSKNYLKKKIAMLKVAG
jgi:hypothetical protein